MFSRAGKMLPCRVELGLPSSVFSAVVKAVVPEPDEGKGKTRPISEWRIPLFREGYPNLRTFSPQVF